MEVFKVMKRLPDITHLELTNECNFNCGYCKRYFSERKRGFISMQTVRNSIKYLKNSTFVELFMNGESLLHPKFGEIVKLVRPYVPYMGIATNGSLVNKNPEILLLDAITISMHDPEKLNISILKDFKGVLRFQYIKGQDASSVKEEWLKMPNVIVDEVDFIDYKKAVINKEVCLNSLVTAAIQWDGDIVPCCRASDKGVVLGNVNDNKKVFVGEYKKWQPCYTCQFPNSYLFHMKLLKEIIEKGEKNEKCR